MNDCIFCKIIQKDIPSHIILEDKYHFAFLDMKPLNPGHVLVIPKHHVRWVWDQTDEEVANLYAFCNRIVHLQRKAFATDWIISEVIGTGVEHAHVHLIPRTKNDKHPKDFLDPNLSTKASAKELHAVQEKLLEVLTSLD